MVICSERKQGNHLFSTIKTTDWSNTCHVIRMAQWRSHLASTSIAPGNCPVAYYNVVVQTLHVTRELICKHPVSLLILFFFPFSSFLS